MLYSGIVLDNDGLPAVLPEVLELHKGEIWLQWANMSCFLWPLFVQNILHSNMFPELDKKVYILHPDIKFTTVPNLTRIRRQSESLSCALHNFYDLGDKPFRTSVSKDASPRYVFIICWLKTLIIPYNFAIINVMVCCDCFTYHIMGVGLSIWATLTFKEFRWFWTLLLFTDN